MQWLPVVFETRPMLRRNNAWGTGRSKKPSLSPRGAFFLAQNGQFFQIKISKTIIYWWDMA